MKLAVAFVVAFGFLGCQSQYYYSLNPFFFSPWSSFNAPRMRYDFYDEQQNDAIHYLLPPHQSYDSQDSIGERSLKENQPRPNYYHSLPNEISPRFFFNYNPAAGYSNNGMVGPALLRTYLYTSVITTTVTSLSRCIPANQFSAGPGATTCIRRRRDIAELLDKLILSDDGEDEVKPSPVDKVEVTALPSAVATKEHQAISSSKDETPGEANDSDLKRNQRFFNLFGLTSTVISYFFVTTTVPKQVSIVAQSAGAPAADVSCGGAAKYSCLACVPPGYGVC